MENQLAVGKRKERKSPGGVVLTNRKKTTVGVNDPLGGANTGTKSHTTGERNQGNT